MIDTKRRVHDCVVLKQNSVAVIGVDDARTQIMPFTEDSLLNRKTCCSPESELLLVGFLLALPREKYAVLAAVDRAFSGDGYIVLSVSVDICGVVHEFCTFPAGFDDRQIDCRVMAEGIFAPSSR